MKKPTPRRLALSIAAGAAALQLVALPAAMADDASLDQSITLQQDGASSFVSPVDLPGPQGERPVFAHYLPVFPRSLDNAPAAQDYYNIQYLRPTGEDGKYSSIGGLVRDRPMPRPALEGDWRAADLRQEVREATQAGLSGFAVDVLATSGANWDRVQALVDAAAAEGNGFTIMLQPDMTSDIVSVSPQALAEKLAGLAASPGVHRGGDGRVMVSPFAAEAKDPEWWQQFNDAMAAHGQPVDLVPIFVNVADNISRYAEVSYGMGEWGSRTPSVIDASPDYAARAHALGKKWVSPISAQDARPISASYIEPTNMAGLRSSWSKAIRTHADMALMVSWNDYSESTQFAPSVDHGQSLLSLNSYYLDWFRRGNVPEITRDGAYVSFRVQKADATPSHQSQLMRLSFVENTPASDLVEVQTILTAPAELAVQVGGSWHMVSAPAGVSTHKLPLGAGTVRLVAIRDGVVLAALTSGQQVRESVGVQDLAYHLMGGPTA